REARDDQFARLAIGNRDRLVARLHLDGELAALHTKDECTGLARQLLRSGELALHQLLPPCGHNSCFASSTDATERPDSFTSSTAAATRSPLLFAMSPLGR